MSTQEDSVDILEEYTGLKSAVGHKTKFTIKDIYLKPTEKLGDALELDEATPFLNEGKTDEKITLENCFRKLYIELQLDQTTFYITVSSNALYSPYETSLLFQFDETTEFGEIELIGKHIAGQLDESLETFTKEQKEQTEKYSVRLKLPEKELLELSELPALQKYLNRFIKFAQIYTTNSNSDDEPIEAQIEDIEQIGDETAHIVVLLGDEKIEFNIEKSVLYRDYEFINSTGEGLLETAIGSKVLLLPNDIYSLSKSEDLYFDSDNYWLLFSEETYEETKQREKEEEDTQDVFSGTRRHSTSQLDNQIDRGGFRSSLLALLFNIVVLAFFNSMDFGFEKQSLQSTVSLMSNLLEASVALFVLTTLLFGVKIMFVKFR